MNNCELCGDEANTVIEIDGVDTRICDICKQFMFDEVDDRNRELSNQSLYG